MTRKEFMAIQKGDVIYMAKSGARRKVLNVKRFRGSRILYQYISLKKVTKRKDGFKGLAVYDQNNCSIFSRKPITCETLPKDRRPV